MNREQLITYIETLEPTGLLDTVLAQLQADAERIEHLERDNLALAKDRDNLVATLQFDRGQTDKRLDDIRSLWEASQNRLVAQMDRTHRIGRAVLRAQQAGRKTVRIDEVAPSGISQRQE